MSHSFVTPWTVAHQASLSMGFPRQEFWSGLPFPYPGNLPNPGIESRPLTFPALVRGLIYPPLSSTSLYPPHSLLLRSSQKDALSVRRKLSINRSCYTRSLLIFCTWTVQFSSVPQSCLTLCDPNGLKHAGPPCPSPPTPGVHSNSCPLSWWCHLPTSSSVDHFSSCLQSFPASGSFQMNQFFESGSQSIGVSASTSVLPMNTQDWSPLGWTGLISLQAKELSRVFSNTTVQKHQFFGAQLSL